MTSNLWFNQSVHQNQPHHPPNLGGFFIYQTQDSHCYICTTSYPGTMKQFILLLLIFLSSQKIWGQTETRIYYTPVNMPASLKNNYYSLFDTKLLAEDLSTLLGKATGKIFTAVAYQPGNTEGIFLLLDSNLTSLGNEEGVLESDGKNYIRIKGRYTTGISYTMYAWLQEMGFHFYLPGDEWAIIPSINNLFDNKAERKNYKPYFRNRIFIPSGGTPAVKGLDEGMQNVKTWQQWYIRNGMGCDYIRIGGHIGEAFNMAHRKEIESDSSILAPVQGKRQFSSAGKLDPTYKKGVSLFSDWIVDQFKKDKTTYPSFLPFRKYFTADAGDGFNYCHTLECEKQFKSVSDQSFSIVNETARKIKQADARAGVSTLAYTERADTPSITIEPNVHTMVVASGFQNVTTAAELMKRWAAKSNNISMYDFLNIGVTSYDKPFFNMKRYHNNLQFLKSLKIEGITFETSYSKFGSGILQYFILKYLCEPYNSIDNALETFCEDNFGPAASPIKKLLTEWYFSDVHLATNSDYPSFYEDELGRFVQYITDAEKNSGITPAIQKRIDELKAYIVYLCKFYELYVELKSVKEYKLNPATRIRKANETLTYTWQLYKTNIFQNTQLNDVLKRLLPDQDKANWDYRKSDRFKSFSDVASPVKEAYESVKKKYLPLAEPDYPITTSFLAAQVQNSADSFRIITTDEQGVSNFMYAVSFYCGTPGTLKIKYEAGKSLLNEKAGKVAIVGIESLDYTFMKTDFIYKENSAGTFSFQVPAAGYYRLFLSQNNSTHISYVVYPGTNLFYINKKSLLLNCMSLQDFTPGNSYPNKYLGVYAPPVDSLFFSNVYVDTKNTSKLYSSTGKPIAVQGSIQPFYNAAQVPKDRKNPFIFFENSSYRLPAVLKNTAPYYFFLKYPLQ